MYAFCLSTTLLAGMSSDDAIHSLSAQLVFVLLVLSLFQVV